MKRIFTSILSAALLLTACQKSDLSTPSSEEGALYATIEEVAATKTYMDANNNIRWASSDQIVGFMKSSLGLQFEIAPSSVGKTSAHFDQVGGNGGGINAGTEWNHNVVYYPYSSTIECEKSGSNYSLNVSLPAEQTYAEGSFGNGSMAMVAVSEGNNITFRNILGGMKLQLKGTQKVKSIKLEGKNNEKLAGAATVTAYTDETKPAIAMASSASTSVTLNCGSGVQLNESAATEFIIALPPVLFSNGFTVIVTDSESHTYTVETDKANTVLRSSLLVMPAFMLGETQGDDSGEGFVEEINLKRTSLTMAPGTSYTFEYGVISTNVIDPTLTWSSSNSNVAIVDQCGKVTAVADGTATITAIALGGANATCSVTVKSATAIADRKYVVGDADYGYGIVIGDVVWAPVNCGYEPATADYKGYPYGKLYQWGRKHGQGDDFWDASYPSGKNLVAGPVMPSEGQSDQNADVFFTVSASPYDWCKVQNDAHWNSETEDAPVKTDTDPCPTGWRVPTYKELRNLTKNPSRNSSWATNDVGQNGRYFSGEYSCIDGAPKVFFPAASHRQDDGRAGDSRGYRGCYWSSRPYSNLAYGLTFADGYCGIGGYSRACGYSVRCVQE